MMSGTVLQLLVTVINEGAGSLNDASPRKMLAATHMRRMLYYMLVFLVGLLT